MDAYEILSTIRNYSKLTTEDLISTVVLKRSANLGMQYVAQQIIQLYHEFLVVSKTFSAITADYVDIPGDTLRILDVEREDSGAIMRLCTRIPVEDKSLIGKNADYPSDENYPAYVHEGKEIYLYPTLSALDVIVRYRRRIMNMAEGEAVYASATTATLGGNAESWDDAYNSYDFAIYTRTGTAVTFQGIYKCTDYAGSTKVVTLDGAGIFADDGTIYYYALIPIIPPEFHNFLIDAGLIELKKSGKFDDGVHWREDMKELNNRLIQTLKIHGLLETELDQ